MSKWYVSFNGNNPEEEDCFEMPDSKTAFRLAEYCNDLFEDNIATVIEDEEE